MWENSTRRKAFWVKDMELSFCHFSSIKKAYILISKKKATLKSLAFLQKHRWLMLTLGQHSRPQPCHSTQYCVKVRASKHLSHEEEHLFNCALFTQKSDRKPAAAILFLISTKLSSSQAILPHIPSVPKGFKLTQKNK